MKIKASATVAIRLPIVNIMLEAPATNKQIEDALKNEFWTIIRSSEKATKATIEVYTKTFSVEE
jgi:hypothetical protein